METSTSLFNGLFRADSHLIECEFVYFEYAHVYGEVFLRCLEENTKNPFYNSLNI